MRNTNQNAREKKKVYFEVLEMDSELSISTKLFLCSHFLCISQALSA